MSYSSTIKAGNVLDELIIQLKSAGTKDSASSNGFYDTSGRFCFYEIGRENRDGAITGKVMRSLKENPNLCSLVGTFRIEPDGKISRFPLSTKNQRSAAETSGLIKYHETFEPGWNNDAVLQSHIKGASFVVV